MHESIDRIRKLAAAYIREEKLDEEQLQMKKHLADCDECYREFCMEFAMLKALSDYGLIGTDMDLELERGGDMAERIILQISKAKDTLARSSIVMSLKGVFQQEALWTFFNMGALAPSRGKGKAEVYRSRISEKSKICYEDGKITVFLAAEDFDGKNLGLLVQDGGRSEQFGFQFDEEEDLYVAETDFGSYGKDATVNIIAIDEHE